MSMESPYDRGAAESSGLAPTKHAGFQGSQSVSASKWVERAARAGYLAKGIVYLIVGGLAVATAFTAGGDTTDSKGALATILEQPFGRVLLGLIALGLVGYAAWRYVQCIADPEDKGTDLQGVVLRGYYAVSGIIHTALVVSAVRMIFGSTGGSSSGGAEEKTATLMSQPFGRWLVGIVGIAVIGSAFYQGYRSWKAKFRDRMHYDSVSQTMREWLIRLGRIGLAARGVVFAITGSFLLISAVRANPDEAKGLAEALRTLEQQPYGPWLLGSVALGLALYGAHQIAKARFRRIG